jgi:hypothetical protein
VHEGEVLAWARRGPSKRVTHYPLHAKRGIDTDLGGDFVRGVLAKQPTVPGVEPFGAFPHHDQVYSPGIRQGATHARVKTCRPQVDMMIKLEA